MANLELDKHLRRVRLPRKKDPKDLLAKMSALLTKFGIAIAASKKVAVILRAGQRYYAKVMIIMCTIIEEAHKRSATLEELVNRCDTQ